MELSGAVQIAASEDMSQLGEVRRLRFRNPKLHRPPSHRSFHQGPGQRTSIGVVGVGIESDTAQVIRIDRLGGLIHDDTRAGHATCPEMTNRTRGVRRRYLC
jgi:hypothetical protein